jgi:hypothetical protein
MSNRVTLTENDLQTIINALCQAQSEAQKAARLMSQARCTELANRLERSAQEYSDLADRLIAADAITSELAQVDDSPPARAPTHAPGGKLTH